MELFETCKELLESMGINSSNIYEEGDIQTDYIKTDRDSMGTIAIASKFLNEYDIANEDFETLEAVVYDNCDKISCSEDYVINDSDFKICSFVISGNCTYAEIWSDEKDCVVAYVRM